MIAAAGAWLTRAIGVASFSTAAVASGIAWGRIQRSQVQRSHVQRSRIARISGERNPQSLKAGRLPMMLTLIHTSLLLDIVFNLRWQLHDFLQGAAMDEHLYQSRRLPQTVVLLALGLVVMLVFAYLVRSYWRSKGALLALLGTGTALASWCMEVISLHQVDAVMYASKGPFMPIAAIWILAGLMTTAGITLYTKAP